MLFLKTCSLPASQREHLSVDSKEHHDPSKKMWMTSCAMTFHTPAMPLTK
eukprot:CAMPEP_0181407810 /NCGR_PEP_ID=MMETSP1110-20121109/5970_1 /TAXON_ID=174948 /ORGANISM="Symbiodinium sp., Strain CCMP421" /LENGTH=49 /DNA_ID=CAMNT_0023530247 /DNA_START=304 /DNA_END=453 /DNA_ORIENTATION=-